MEYSSFIVRRGSSVSNVLLMLAGELVSSCLCRAILARSCSSLFRGDYRTTFAFNFGARSCDTSELKGVNKFPRGTSSLIGFDARVHRQLHCFHLLASK
ncbi:hypothetical protein CC77DRAFT_1026524 [Alternaria alternata]|uniref:Uncharacterized protein n=1 Tax=Alternaria alternata TaxID=5599 RepID=A0A177D1W8_ALTAL|nr:hypothetical protein CC77DRAFT_1026524 [Alternaria alternata]OAG13653.1 hypothetical protein CC77DRAFT_1026524 [Alternaria alternata]